MNDCFEIHIGERYRYYGKSYEIIDIRDERVTFRSTDRCRSVIHQSYEKLQITHQKGHFIKFQEAPLENDNSQIIDSLSEQNKQQFEFRKKYADALLKEFYGKLPKKETINFVRKIASEINDPNPPGYTSIYKWVTAYKKSGRNLFSLLDPIRKRKPRIVRWHPEIKGLLNYYLDLFYLKPEHSSMSEVISGVRESATDANESRPPWDQIRIPSVTTLYRIIKEIDPLEISTKQQGCKKATREYQFSRKCNEPLRAYEQAEDDNHICDVIAVDKYGRPIGRPHLTVILFTAARYVSGYDLSFNAPSLAKTIRALKHSLRNDREYTGVVDQYKFDNGPEFEPVGLRDSIELLGATVTYCQPYAPEQKPHIESWFHTLVIQFTHTLKGTTFSNLDERGDYDSEDEAVYTIDKLREKFDRFLDNYHNRPHSALNGLSPKQAMQKLQADQFPPRRYSPEQLDNLFRSETSSCVVNGRVRYKYLQWTGPGVAKIGSHLRKNQRALIYYDESELGQVIVIHPTRPELKFVANAVDPDYQCGLTMYMHNRLRAKLKESDKEFSFREAKKARIALLVELALGKSKLTRKQKAIMDDITKENDEKIQGSTPKAKLGDENPEYIPLLDSPPTPTDYSVVKVSHAKNDSGDN